MCQFMVDGLQTILLANSVLLRLLLLLLPLQMPPNTAFTITPCPVPEDDTGTLTFVSSMYMLPGGQTLSAQLPESLYKHLLMSFASQAQQFRGYMFNWNTLHAKEVRWCAFLVGGLHVQCVGAAWSTAGFLHTNLWLLHCMVTWPVPARRCIWPS
jgi:hypothetical protein